MQIEYRLLEKSRDYYQQRKLFLLSFPEAQGTPAETDAHFTWKFESYPAPAPSYQYVAAEGAALAGYYAAIPFSYSLDARPATCGMVCDVMTHPEWRGKGIFTGIGNFAISEMKAAGLGFTTGYPIRPEVIPGHLKVGWKTVKSLPVYLRILGVRTLLPRAFKFLAPVLDRVVRLLQFWARTSRPGYSTKVLSRSDFLDRQCQDGGEYTKFLANWSRMPGNTLVKSREFLRWRTAAPGTEYLFITLHNNGNLVGLAIARPVLMKNVEALALLDFMVLPEHVCGSRALHEQIRNVALQYRKDVVACMCGRQSAKLYQFAAAAYLRSHLTFTLIVKKLDQDIADEMLYSESRWSPFWLDSDDL